MSTDEAVRRLFDEVPHTGSGAFRRYLKLREQERRSGTGGSNPPQEEVVRLRSQSPPKTQLFDYQEELVDRILSARVQDRILLSLPTGGGKTRTSLVAISRGLESGQIRKVAWLAPTRELLDQALATSTAVWEMEGKSYDLDLVRAFSGHGLRTGERSSIVFMTPQMLVSRMDEVGLLGDIDLVVFDEAHHAVAPTYLEAIERLLENGKGRTQLLGLTATPGRSTEVETRRLVRFFHGNLITASRLGANPVKSLQDLGVLARVFFHFLEPRESGSFFARRYQGLSNSDLQFHARRFSHVLDKVVELAATERVLVFAASIAHAAALAAALLSRDVRAAPVISDQSTGLREALIRGFRDGRVPVIINKEILTTGFDLPQVAQAVLTVPIRSAIQFEQIVGRVGRGQAVGGSPEGHVWQFEDHPALHGVPASYGRFRDYDWVEGKRD